MRAGSQSQLACSTATQIQFVRTREAGRIVIRSNNAQNEARAAPDRDTSQDDVFCSLPEQEPRQPRVAHQFFDSLLSKT
jgi:hypothetical protein